MPFNTMKLLLKKITSGKERVFPFTVLMLEHDINILYYSKAWNYYLTA